MPDRRPSFRTILYLAVFIGLVAVLGAFKALQATGLAARVATQRIVVAVREIPEGSIVHRQAVATTDWPTRAVPAGAFTAIDSVVGRVARVALFAGEPLVPGRLAHVGSGTGLGVQIERGKRAMAVFIDDVPDIRGLIRARSRVDVLVTLRPDGPGHRQVAKVFMENVRVLALGSQTERDADGEPIDVTTATLEVTPDEAERLAVALNQGSIRLVLRGYGDQASVTTSGASSADVLAELRHGRAAQRRQSRRAVPRPAPESPATPDPTTGVESGLAAELPATPTPADSAATAVRKP
jgi:pilus assembly protein CpaB